ncbi:BatD family protein [Ancylobacter oerskovii]|uniref:BatD family protein n=1 Tax=Ancylobacter oerskovii TaxID=459519 RepID=A0ABW4YWJ2_9HYPH|nr:BatD family protein [Ancylobacter oerskovii]MBS7544122.1 BatD family protein [Ancylobacter oerskovii]
MVRRILLLVFLLCAGGAHADSLRLVVPEAKPVVGEMIPVTLRGEYTRLIALETLTFPNSDDYDWMQLARDQWRDEQIGGRTVRVFERRLAVFPRRAGVLTIGPVVHHLTLVGVDNLREPFDVTAPAVTLPVAPFPAEGRPLSARSLTIEDTLSAAPGALRDGESLVRRVVLKAAGTLPHLLPPRPILREPWLISFVAPERRETRLTPEGPVSTVTWEWHLRPKTGEPGVLPAVSIPWFDTVTRQMRTAEIAAIPFGYASFGDNRSGVDRLPVADLAAGLLVFAAGIGAGLVAVLAGASRRRAGVLRTLRRLSPFDPARRRLKRLARTGDLPAIRRAADRYLRRRRELGLAVTGRETARLDEILYRPSEGIAPREAETAIRGLLNHR